MTIVFWLSFVGILYIYAGYPTIMWLLARLLPWRRSIAPNTPDVSIVLAVHNGGALLHHKIQHLIALDYPRLKEIIVVSDGSTDGTAEFLDSRHHPLVKSVILENHGGKAAAINAGVMEATADVIVFVDIRPEIAPGAIQQLIRNFADPKVGCVAGELLLRQQDHDAASGAVGGIYWRYEQWIRKCEAEFDSPVGVYGGFYAIRRELFVPMPAGLILDDMFQPLSIIRRGYRSVIETGANVYDTWPKKVEGEFSRKVRTLAGNFQLFRLAPWTLTPHNRLLFQLVSHKVMRLAAPYLLALLLTSTLILSGRSPIYTAFAALQVAGWAAAIAGLRYKIPLLHRIAAPASALLLLNCAAVVGLYKFIFTRGPLWMIWKPTTPESNGQTTEAGNLEPPEHVSAGVAVDIGRN